MFKHDGADRPNTVEVTLDGRAVAVPEKINVAAALLSLGENISRISPSSHQPCSPHCLMGVCFECMMEIDGVQRQACMIEVREGMIINRDLESHKGAS